jgi:Skp family chaperone for outer membrane proteins
MMQRVTYCLLVTVVFLNAGWLGGWFDDPQTGAAQDAENSTARPPAAGSDIAVIDTARVFNSHGSFKQRMETLKKAVTETQQKVAVRQAEIQSVQKRLQGLKPNTKPFEETQLLLTRLQTELKLLTDRKQEDFLEQEAALYRDAFAQVEQAIRQYADKNGIRLVLRANHQPINPEDRKTILAAVNRIVVYQQGLDITDTIIQAVNASEDAI